MNFPSARDCEHGRQRGKCSDCDASSEIADLTAELESSKSEVRKLQEQIAAQSALLQHWMIQRAEAEIRAARKNKLMPNDLAKPPGAALCDRSA